MESMTQSRDQSGRMYRSSFIISKMVKAYFYTAFCLFTHNYDKNEELNQEVNLQLLMEI